MSYEIVFTDTSKNQFKKLVGDLGYRLRVGDYRVILDIYNDELIILDIKIGYRKNIYKKI